MNIILDTFPGVLRIGYINLRIEWLLLRDIFTSQNGTLDSIVELE